MIYIINIYIYTILDKNIKNVVIILLIAFKNVEPALVKLFGN